MNRVQKMAWYQLIVIAAVLILTSVVVTALALLFGLPHVRDGLSTLGLLGLLGLSQLIFKKRSARVDIDERDLLIQRKATAIAYSVFWVLWIAGSMIIWAIKKHENSVSVDVLPIFVLAGGLVVVVVQSVAILVQYGWKGKDGGK